MTTSTTGSTTPVEPGVATTVTRATRTSATRPTIAKRVTAVTPVLSLGKAAAPQSTGACGRASTITRLFSMALTGSQFTSPARERKRDPTGTTTGGATTSAGADSNIWWS